MQTDFRFCDLNDCTMVSLFVFKEVEYFVIKLFLIFLKAICFIV